MGRANSQPSSVNMARFGRYEYRQLLAEARASHTLSLLGLMASALRSRPNRPLRSVVALCVSMSMLVLGQKLAFTIVLRHMRVALDPAGEDVKAGGKVARVDNVRVAASKAVATPAKCWEDSAQCCRCTLV